MLGLFQPGVPWDLTQLSQFETASGRKAAIVHWFQDWANDPALHLDLIRKVADHGSIPMITWEPWNWSQGVNQPRYSLARIIAGDFDSHARSWATGLAAYGGPVLLRWAHEMNGDWTPWGNGVNGNLPGQYVQAWRHLRAIFRAAGASNVRWVWSPNVAYDAGTAFESFFPGDADTEWVALDGYNWGFTDAVHGGTWQSFGEIFADSYRRITSISTRPAMIAETGSADGPGDKAAWIRDALGSNLPILYPRVRAVVWFNEHKERNWTIGSSAASLEAFTEAARSSMYAFSISDFPNL
ncbi:MAG TPA: glycosyl hydrolase [Deinococcales bacterium]|nr:glycosyl hydrolase [Deinococcales bacterium]